MLHLSVSSDRGCVGGVGVEAGFGFTSSGCASLADFQTPIDDGMIPQDVPVVTTSLFDSLRPPISAPRPAADAIQSAAAESDDCARTIHSAPLSDAGLAGGEGGGNTAAAAGGAAAASAAGVDSSVPLLSTAIDDGSAPSSSAEEGRHPEHSSFVHADNNDDLVEGWRQVCGHT